MTKLPTYYSLPIGRLSGIFDKTSTSYKIYWFYAILKSIKDNKSTISIEELIAKMIALTWYSVNFYKISLGKQDKLANAVNLVKKNTNDTLKYDAHEEIVFAEIMSQLKTSTQLKKAINDLKRYVPYRLLTPFIIEHLKKKPSSNSSKKHQYIVELANMSYKESGISTCLYRFVNKNSIEIHPLWFQYLKNNIRILEDFCLWNLNKYLQRRNPHIPNIGEKVFAPPLQRDLANARKLWNLVFKQQEINCIFSRNPVPKTSYSIDHFIPWSFVTHDMLWNLVPIPKEVNSSKSNNIPSLILYFADFADLQYNAFQVIHQLKKKKLMEDYCILFDSREDEIVSFSRQAFSEKLRNHIAPLSQIAENSGFLGNWIYNNLDVT